MKKTNLYIALLSVFTMINIIGCDDYLEEVNFSRIQKQEVFKSIEGADAAVLGVYSLLSESGPGLPGNLFGANGTWFRGNNWMSSCNNDEQLLEPDPNFNSPAWITLSSLSYTSTNIQITSTWIGLYQGIFRANAVLNNIDNIIDESPELIASLKGEARFMRGFYYFYLMTYYGGVPIVNQETRDNTITRSSVEDVAALIEADWLYAQENIIDEKMNHNGRAGQLTATAYLAKLHLYLASAKESKVYNGIEPFPLNSFNWVDDKEHYNKAKDYADKVYDSDSYSLVDNYGMLFVKAGSEEQRDEFIFNIQTNAQNGVRYSRSAVTLGSNGLGGGQGLLRPNVHMYDLYFEGDTRREANLSGGKLKEKNGVESLNGMKYIKVTPVKPKNLDKNNSIFVNKYRNPAFDLGELKENTNTVLDTNIPLLRYADLLLIRAEAHYKVKASRAGIPNEMLSEVRQRSLHKKVDIDKVNNHYLKDDFMEELLEERSRELAFEGWRRIDLFRTNKYEDRIEAIDSDKKTPSNLLPRLSQIQLNYADYKMWYPIPQRALELSPNIIQNPGYLDNN